MRTALILLCAVAVLACSGAGEVEEGMLEVNGTELFYKARGSGEPIVVVHGGPGFDHRQFLPFVWELARGPRVILYDQRGTGLSSGPVDEASVNIDTFVADLDGVRQAFGIDRMNLVGHSWGGILAMHYAIRHPERLRSLVLCSTTASAAAFSEMRANYEADRQPGDAQRLSEIYTSEAFRAGDPAAVESFWRVYFKPYFADQSMAERLDLHFTENTIKNGNTVASLVLKSIGDFDLHEQLEAVRCPTLVLHGDADPMPVRYAESIHQSIEGSELVIIEGSGHWPFVDATATFTSAILEFLDEIDEVR